MNAPATPRSRRQVLASGAVGATLGLAGCLSTLTGPSDPPRVVDGASCGADLPPPSATASGGWTMAGHDAGATGHNPAVDASSAPGAPAWTVTLPAGQAPASPVVGEDRVYVSVANYDPTPAETRLVAYALADGARLWERDLPYADPTVPALAPDGDGSGTLYVVSGQDEGTTEPGTGVVLALDPATGDERWRWPLDRRLAGPPVVAGRRVYVTSTPYGDTAVHALDPTDGTELWSRGTGPVLHVAPTVAGDTVFTSTGRDRLGALDATDGTVIWDRDVPADDTRPVVDAARGHVLLGFDRGLTAYCADTGERAWTLVTTNPDTDEADYLGVVTEPVVTEDLLVVQTDDTSPSELGALGHLYGLDPATGRVEWHHGDWHPAGPAVGAGDGTLIARNLPGDDEDGLGVPWRHPPGSDVADGTVAWTLDAAWRPVAVGANRMLGVRGDTASASEPVDVGCFRFS